MQSMNNLSEDEAEAPAINNAIKRGTTINFYHCSFKNTNI